MSREEIQVRDPLVRLLPCRNVAGSVLDLLSFRGPQGRSSAYRPYRGRRTLAASPSYPVAFANGSDGSNWGLREGPICAVNQRQAGTVVCE
jgi:hypothetical protein